MTETLFTPVTAGKIALANRIAMAPLTRNRADDATDLVGDLQVEYYEQRASAGLIITEATQISPEGKGYIMAPGIYTDEHVAAWKKVTDAVHAKGGKIVIQLWHVGRISHTSIQPNGQAPVAPSAIAAKGKTFTQNGFEDTSVPRALDIDEMPRIVADYVHAVKCARAAGFDGVEIHAANGYLLDQFLKDGVNKRTDAYGGSVENRARLLFEVMDAVTAEWDAGYIGIRLSPFSPANDATDSDPLATFTPVVERLNTYGLSYLHMVEGATGGPRDGAFDTLRKSWTGTYMGNNGYDRDLATARVDDGSVDIVAFGRPFIANPDLVARLEKNAPLNDMDADTLYGGGAQGYTDYPTL
ncbi:N-ethylmaleimide reductase [Aquimixticola soesokkakensis]|uniref:N-ethylmaleimide reductase n=1 Tax=Aquimixticola soesokkakensis TaxID=1519096 RepID=A0A1Y5SST0_9RHOB|nr:alkene reductase [Aquimixticola soesokkakensis]SLN44335.1 N-ethylmaleimide reductase [Aquimixticola soesokkakensis]